MDIHMVILMHHLMVSLMDIPMDFLMESLPTECHMDPLMHHPLTPLIMLHHMQILIVYPKDILTHPLMDIPMDPLTHPPMGLPLHMDHLMDILILMLPLKDITIDLLMDILLILMHPTPSHTLPWGSP